MWRNMNNGMEDKYILTERQAETYLKQALGRRYSVYRRLSSVYGIGGDIGKAFRQITDSVLQDLVNEIGGPMTRKDNDIPFTDEYPVMVYNEIVRRVGPVETSVDEASGKRGTVRIMNITLRNKVWRIAYRHRNLYSLEWDGDGVHNHVWNILSYGWSNYYKGEWTECMNPSTAAELFLMLDDMAGYLDEEILRTFYKVRKDHMCRQIRQVTAEALSASSEDSDLRQ